MLTDSQTYKKNSGTAYWETRPPQTDCPGNADELITLITQYLKTEINYYHSLLLVLQQERDILLSGQHDQLLPNCENKMALSEELHDIQRERQELLAQFHTPDEEGGEAGKLSQLIPLVEEGRRPEYRALLQEADTLSRRLRDLNEINRVYINEALDGISHILAIFTGQQEGGYNALGSRTPAQRRRILAREV
ncbi:MAG: flagellar protein FlgN [Desulfarculales bacterium]|jgi:flagellar biosynthesis/type III secretory pathway chaperone|nr:flagellar protein FlgN [Desulfarculales bacterium]